MQINDLVKKPGAWTPIAISIAMLAFVLVYVAVVPQTTAQTEDEGAPARIFQLLMFVQALIIVGFAFKWIPRAPKQTFAVLAMQIAAAVVPVATIIFLEK